MAKLTLTNAWTALEPNTGVIQNISNKNVPIEVSDEQVVGTGQVLYPKEAMNFSGVQLYARTTLSNTTAEARVNPFVDAVGSGGGTTYTLPTASSTTKGGVKVGNGLTIADAVLSVDTGTTAGKIVKVGSDGKLDKSLIPAVQLGDTYVRSSEADMLALTAKVGDVCVRSDLKKSYILQSSPATTLANWVYLETPADAVTSVNGKTGAVTITTPTASATTLGGIKVGENLSIDSNGVLSAEGGIDEWVASDKYAIGDMVVKNNTIYRCKVANQDATFTASKWDTINAGCVFGYSGSAIIPDGDLPASGGSSGSSGAGGAGVVAWEASKAYTANQLTYTNDKLYICVEDHTSGADFATDLLSGKWKFIGNGVGSNVSKQILYQNSSGLTSSGTAVTDTTASDYKDCDYVIFNYQPSGSSLMFTAISKVNSLSENLTTTKYSDYINASGVKQYLNVHFTLTSTNISVNLNEHSSGWTGVKLFSVTGIKITELTTDYLAGLAMPSDVYVSIPWVANSSTTYSNQTYTAEADGYISVVVKINAGGGAHVYKEVGTVNVGLASASVMSSYKLYTPVKKGDVIIFRSCNVPTLYGVAFIYSVGAAKALGLI